MQLSSFRSLSIGDTVCNSRGQALPVTNIFTRVIDGTPVAFIEVITVADGPLTLNEEHIGFINAGVGQPEFVN